MVVTAPIEFISLSNARKLRGSLRPLVEQPKAPPEPEDNYSGRFHARMQAYARVLPPAPSYASEHMRMKPVMDKVRADPQGLLRPIAAGFKVFCSPEDHPDGEYAPKSPALVATVHCRWADETITGLDIRLDNPADIGWVNAKIRKLFAQADMDMPAYYINP